MNAQGIVQDRIERRTRYHWARDIEVEPQYRQLERETAERDRAVDQAVFSIQEEINGLALRTLHYEYLAEKYGETELLYQAVTSIVSTAVRYALTYLGDFQENDHVWTRMRVTRELYRRLQIPWRFDRSLPIPDD